MINGEYIGSEEDILAGFVNNELRGKVSGLIFPLTEEIVFSLMLYGNQAEGEIIDFKYYHAASDQVFCLNETIEFQSDMIIGNALAPFEFNINEDFILGCTDATACNYNPESNFNDGSCEYAENNYDCNGECLNDSDGDSSCDESYRCE